MTDQDSREITEKDLDDIKSRNEKAAAYEVAPGVEYRRALRVFRTTGCLPESVYLYDSVGKAILRYQAEVNQRACESGAHEIVIRIPDPERQPFVTKDTQGEDVLMVPGPKFRFEPDGSCSHVPEAVMPSFRAIACNTIVFNSQFFESVYDPEKHDIMVAYAQVYTRSKVFRGDLGAKLQWKVSLYSTKSTIDCGAIAKAFGGGGHAGAGGFVCDKLPWEV